MVRYFSLEENGFATGAGSHTPQAIHARARTHTPYTYTATPGVTPHIDSHTPIHMAEYPSTHARSLPHPSPSPSTEARKRGWVRGCGVGKDGRGAVLSEDGQTSCGPSQSDGLPRPAGRRCQHCSSWRRAGLLEAGRRALARSSSAPDIMCSGSAGPGRTRRLGSTDLRPPWMRVAGHPSTGTDRNFSSTGSARPLSNSGPATAYVAVTGSRPAPGARSRIASRRIRAGGQRRPSGVMSPSHEILRAPRREGCSRLLWA